MADGTKVQSIVAQALEEYTDRHNVNFAEQGAKDLKTLSTCNPASLPQLFRSNVEAGLSPAEVTANGQKYGVNEYKKRKKRTLLQIFKEAICDEMLIILIVAAVVSVIV